MQYLWIFESWSTVKKQNSVNLLCNRNKLIIENMEADDDKICDKK
jgi:hypothetical protein